MMANTLRKHASQVGIWTSAPRRFYRHLDASVETHMVPSPVDLAARLFKRRFSEDVHRRGVAWWDRAVTMVLPRSPLVIGFATQSLATCRWAHRNGSRFALDRACPHVDFQQTIVREESERTGAAFTQEPAWFHERQLAEYEEADVIVVPSRYSGNTFPAHLQKKILLAPLLGRAAAKGEIRYARNTPFTVGVLGGQPLRKGYLYLLEAWKRLALPNARLLIRSSGDFDEYPKLKELIATTPDVELLDYIPNIAEFYQRCDLFVLPSVDDGFGMALFEAMANGVPCIATTHCGASELLTSGVDGIVIPPRSTEQLQAAMESLYRDEELRQSIARAGVQTVERISASSQYEDAMLQLLHNRQPATSVA